jgi:hypothetical protein
MFIRHLLGLSLLLISLSLPLTLAQTPAQPDTRTPPPGVNIIINSKLVRFAAQAEFSEWRLEVLNQRGESVFDSGLVSSPTLDWPLYNQQGEAVESGLYAYTLTLKIPNSDSQRAQRGHIILDRAGSSSDQIWVTSRNETGIGGDSGAPQLTVTGSSESVIGGARVTTENERPALQRTSDGRALEEQGRNDPADTQPKPTNALNIAGTGTTGLLSKWLDGPNGVLGDSVVSESNGKIGIGTAAPLAKLQVVTASDTNPSFVTAWDTRHFVVGGAAISGGISLSYDQNNQVGHIYALSPNVAWRNLVLQSGGGNVGIGTTAPIYKLHIGVADQGLRVEGPNGVGTAVSLGGNGAFSIDAPGVVGGRFVVKDGGNVGIGTNAPAAKLHISGSGGIRARINADTNAGLALTLNNQPKWSVATVGTGQFQIFNDAIGQNAVWIDSTSNNVGIGTIAPQSTLHVHGAEVLSTGNQSGFKFRNRGSSSFADDWVWYSDANIARFWRTGAGDLLGVTPGGDVGIGTTAPAAKLHISGSGSIRARINADTNAGLALTLNNQPKWSVATVGTGQFQIFNDAIGQNAVWIDPTSNNVGIGTTNPAAKLHVAGVASVGVLQITGGSDLAEPFEVGGVETIQPGMVVAIDPEQPGQLRLADKGYDRTVAGIVSGANGIKPGLTMRQEGTLANGSLPVALTGRVYCWADASNGPIEPGDLLTTSNTPGHAMKVTNYAEAQGAIIGKAMTGLKEGKGLVMVLVTLQ